MPSLEPFCKLLKNIMLMYWVLLQTRSVPEYFLLEAIPKLHSLRSKRYDQQLIASNIYRMVHLLALTESDRFIMTAKHWQHTRTSSWSLALFVAELLFFQWNNFLAQLLVTILIRILDLNQVLPFVLHHPKLDCCWLTIMITHLTWCTCPKVFSIPFLLIQLVPVVDEKITQVTYPPQLMLKFTCKVYNCVFFNC